MASMTYIRTIGPGLGRVKRWPMISGMAISPRALPTMRIEAALPVTVVYSCSQAIPLGKSEAMNSPIRALPIHRTCALPSTNSDSSRDVPRQPMRSASNIFKGEMTLARQIARPRPRAKVPQKRAAT